MDQDKYDDAWNEYEKERELTRKQEGEKRWRQEHDARLARLGLRSPGESRGDTRCIHCGQPFLIYTSSGGDHGLCQYCMDID